MKQLNRYLYETSQRATFTPNKTSITVSILYNNLHIVLVLYLCCTLTFYKLKTEHYVMNGCTVSICALDLSKAFDKVDHFGLL